MKTAFRTTLLSLVLAATAAVGQEPPNGPRRTDPAWHALVGATVHVAPGETLEGATVVIRDGRIEKVSTDPAPAGARVWDLNGHHLHAGFIDAFVPVDAPRPPKTAPLRHWNPGVMPERSALDGPGLSAETAKALRELGFTAAAIAPKGGIFRGTASVVSLAERGTEQGAVPPPVYRPRAWLVAGFETAHGPDAPYPGSEMGAIALMRQTIIDGAAGDERILFDTRYELQALRAAKIAAEFGRPAVVLGSGLEFRRIAAIAGTRLPFVVPLAYPAKPRVGSVGDAEAADLRALMNWEQGPTNPRRLDAAGVEVSLTTARLPDRSAFGKRLREAIRHGLSEERALAMLTTHPAKVLGLADEMGTIAEGKLANLVVTDGPLFDEHTRVRFAFIDGKPHEIRPARWTGTWESEAGTLLVDHEDKVKVADHETKAEVTGDRLALAFETEDGWVRISGIRSGEVIRGDGVRPDGSTFAFAARRTSKEAPKGEEDEGRGDETPPEVPEEYGLPFGPYALDGPPEQPENLLVIGATIWTCEPAGVIENGVLLVKGGKIAYVGPAQGLTAPDEVVLIDATGMHVTPGIVDCHSHTGISGDVNESRQAVTAEVRIEDVTDPDDVNWYRQLAGGVTTANTLHGSANPIGGQNCVQKLRWGAVHPDDMHFEGAFPGIKFALGENVKQSNWGDDNVTRYPQTRMGVETLIRDRLTAAREYAAAIAAGREVRRDLELEALAEVLAGKRLIHCHAYRQDEILMLARLAKEFGFRMGVWQHGLECYKVAEVVKASCGASLFSDWWAYKVEVQDAIPYAGALLWETGALVSYNSDSSELARRLNLEAAKAVKYGGVPPEEALEFVTLNPAKQLRIDDRVGSLAPGKDADFVVWSGNPLSTRTRCLRTFIEGREYFSVHRDKEHRERIAAERRRLIEKALAAPDEEGGEGPGKKRAYRTSCCYDEGGVR